MLKPTLLAVLVGLACAGGSAQAADCALPDAQATWVRAWAARYNR